MSSILNAFVASLCGATADSKTDTRGDAKEDFITLIETMDLFVTRSPDYNRIEISTIFDKLMHQFSKLGRTEFLKTAVAKSSLPLVLQTQSVQDLFERLEAGKKKRNVADNFKHVVTDNFKTDMVVTFNLRSLKNYFELRANGAAWFQIQRLAEEMIKATPRKYLELIVKPDKLAKILDKK